MYQRSLFSRENDFCIVVMSLCSYQYEHAQAFLYYTEEAKNGDTLHWTLSKKTLWMMNLANIKQTVVNKCDKEC